jgi:AcrR family transcriptional regulator
MKEKKLLILEAALKCFAQKGYHATSIQEIVDSVGIAKGSVYFYFKSKEDLLFSVLTYFHDQFITTFNAVDDEAELPPKERFSKQLTIQFRLQAEHGDFLVMLMNEQVINISDDMRRFMFDMKGQAFRWSYTGIVDIYGDPVKPFAYDAAMILQGMISEYTGYLLFGGQTINPEKISSFLLARLDDAVAGMIREQRKPLISEQDIQNMWSKFSLVPAPVPEWRQEINHFREALTNAKKNLKRKEELLSSLVVLENEWLRPEPQPIILKGMIALLRSHTSAEPLLQTIARLESLLPK